MRYGFSMFLREGGGAVRNSLCCLHLNGVSSQLVRGPVSHVPSCKGPCVPPSCSRTISASLILNMNQIFNSPEEPLCKGALWWVEMKDRVGDVESCYADDPSSIYQSSVWICV